MHRCYDITESTELLGTSRMEPCDPVPAGSTGTWKFIYRAGKYGMEDSGAIRLAWRMVSDWEIPQMEDPKGYAYTTVTASAEGCVFQVQYDRFIRPYTNSLLIRLLRGSIQEGDEITITWGDTSQGGKGARAQSYQEKGHEFLLLVDATGSGVFRLVDHPMKIDVIAGSPYRLQAVLPGTVEPDEPCSITVRCLDAWGNPAVDYIGNVDVHICTETHTEHAVVMRFRKEDQGLIRTKDIKIPKEVTFRIHLTDEEHHMEAWSNPCIVRKYHSAGPQNMRLLWADMHGQNADTLGSGTLDEYYRFSRDAAAVDVTGWQGNDFEITSDVWEKVKEKTASYNEDGRFITFLGYEWSGATPRGGDYNIFYRNDEETFYPSSDWLTEGDIPEERVRTSASALWKEFSGREQDVLAIPHVGGRCGNLAYVDERFTPVVEVHSHHGTFDWFALEAMRRHLHVGFAGSSDDHTCRVGLFLPCAGKTPSGGFDVASGFTGIWSTGFTKQEIWEALKSRHCYASTFTRIIAEAHIGSFMMGDEISREEYFALKRQSEDGIVQYRIHAAGAMPVERICIYNWEKQIADIPMRKAEENRILIRWKGVIPGGKHKSTSWNGVLEVLGNQILEVKDYGFDREDQGTDWCEPDNLVRFVSTSSGDYDGMKLLLEKAKEGTIRFSCEQGACEVRIEDLTEHPVTIDLNANCSVEFLKTAAPLLEERAWIRACDVSVEVPVEITEEETAWWAKVILENGDAAWITPVFVSGII